MLDLPTGVRAHKPDKLRQLGIMSLNGMFDEMDGVGVLRQAVTELLADDVAIVSSFGADSSVLLHMVSEVDKDLPVYFLETGKHFPETLDYVETLKRHLGLTNVIALHPDDKDVQRFDPKGDLWETDPDSCCHIRKTEPLDAAVAGYGGWVTGRKRYQTAERGVLPHFELTSDDRIKVNPLAYFSDADITTYKLKYGLPEHPLYNKGYKSIGCAPCTSVVAEGEDPRAGRWRGLNKKECGIHFDFNGAIAKPMAAQDLEPVQGRQAFIADPFHPWAEGAMTPARSATLHIPLPVFLENRDAVLANPHPGRPAGLTGRQHRARRKGSRPLRFGRHQLPGLYRRPRLFVGAPACPSATTTRASCAPWATCCTTRFQLMRRCGITAFVVKHEPTRKALAEGKLADRRYLLPARRARPRFRSAPAPSSAASVENA
jgi:phosphoadenosine phosphosulfate reductase